MNADQWAALILLGIAVVMTVACIVWAVCCPDCTHGKPPPLARPRRPGTCWICGEPAVDDELQCDRHGESA